MSPQDSKIVEASLCALNALLLRERSVPASQQMSSFELHSSGLVSALLRVCRSEILAPLVTRSLTNDACELLAVKLVGVLESIEKLAVFHYDTPSHGLQVCVQFSQYIEVVALNYSD